MHIDFIEIQGVEMLTYLPTSEELIWVKLQPMASESYEFAANRKQKKIHSSFQIKIENFLAASLWVNDGLTIVRIAHKPL